LFIQAGGSLETRNQTVIILRRSDRRLIGSMNGARLHARDEVECQWSEKRLVAWDVLEDHLNEIPLSGARRV
jgi:hypothetical protein